MPPNTARYWVDRYKDLRTEEGYPLSLLVEVFAAHNAPISPEALVAAARVRRVRGTSRRHEEAPRTTEGMVPADAFAAFVGQFAAANAANGEAILDELRGIRAALEADRAQRQANAARLEALEAAVAAAQAETAVLRATLTPPALPARRERPWWRRLLGRG